MTIERPAADQAQDKPSKPGVSAIEVGGIGANSSTDLKHVPRDIWSSIWAGPIHVFQLRTPENSSSSEPTYLNSLMRVDVHGVVHEQRIIAEWHEAKIRSAREHKEGKACGDRDELNHDDGEHAGCVRRPAGYGLISEDANPLQPQ